MHTNQSVNSQFFWIAIFITITTTLLLLRHNPVTNPVHKNLTAREPGIIPLDILYRDPVPQTVDWTAMDYPESGQNDVMAQPWIVLLKESADREQAERLQRVFTKRRIDLLMRTPGNIYMAVIRFDSEADANAELDDLRLHASDLAVFNILPCVKDLRQFVQKQAIP